MGGGIGMGNTCKPMAVSFQCMTKFTTNKKKRNCATLTQWTQVMKMKELQLCTNRLFGTMDFTHNFLSILLFCDINNK